MGNGTKGALVKILVAALVGGGAIWLSSFASQRVSVLQKYPYIPPALMAGAGILLLRRGRLASGLGLAGAAGVVALMVLQQKGYLAIPSAAEQKTDQTAGYPDAGRDGVAYNSGWREMPARGAAGSLQGAAARALLAQQSTMGVGDAGAMLGSVSERVREAMGLAA